MFGLPLAFAAPALLAGLIALPVIWWLLRATPPRPKEEIFPPLRILARVLKTEETPQKSPWWLTALRLLIAALIIAALAGPLWNPRERVVAESGALALAIDNGWASATDWPDRVATAQDLIGEAAGDGQPILLAFTAEPANSAVGPFDAAEARRRLAAAVPRPVPVDRAATFERLASAAADLGARPNVAFLSDGLATPSDADAFVALDKAAPARLILATPDRLPAVIATGAENEADALAVTLSRPGASGADMMSLGAYDSRGRRIADAETLFTPGETEAEARFEVPFDLRNDMVRIAVDGADQAGAVRLLDEDARRRRVGLIGGRGAEAGSQPLLSPLFYIRRALSPFADLVEPSTGILDDAVRTVLEQKPAMIVLADVGVLPEAVERDLLRWVNGGGMLVRFAGPRLAGSETGSDPLLPVELRGGERTLGGALSFDEPQPVADFPEDGPFANLIAAERGDGAASGSGRALARPERALMGHAAGRHAARDRARRGQGHPGAVPRHARGELVEPAALRQLRRHAARIDPAVAQPGTPGRHGREGADERARPLAGARRARRLLAPPVLKPGRWSRRRRRPRSPIRRASTAAKTPSLR